MATLTIPNVPPSVLAFLADRAAKANRTVEEEALSLIEARSVSETPEIILGPEIAAPFDLDIAGPAERITPSEAGSPRLECWFDEDKVSG